MIKKLYVSRDLENILPEILRTFPAMVITGPRQSGKSTLLRTFLGRKYAYFTFDDPLTRERALSDPRGFLEQGGPFMIIDEIQYVPELLSYVKILIDEKRRKTGRFIFTGSQQFSLIKSLGDSLAGRIAVLELLPFTVTEKRRFHKDKKPSWNSKQYYIDACLRGSFPELVTSPKKDVQYWYAAYLQTYLERDIRTLANIGNLRDFQRFFHLLAARCGQTLQLSTIANDIGVSVNTIKRWVSVLEASRMIFLLSPYYRNMGKRIIKSPKIYFTDCGLVCNLLSINTQDQLFNGPIAGVLFENFCIQEAVKHFLHRGLRPNIYFARTHNGLEMDMLIENNGKLFPFECKLTKTPTLSMGNSTQRFRELFPALNIQEGKILCMADKSMPLAKHVSVQNIDDYITWLAAK